MTMSCKFQVVVTMILTCAASSFASSPPQGTSTMTARITRDPQTGLKGSVVAKEGTSSVTYFGTLAPNAPWSPALPSDPTEYQFMQTIGEPVLGPLVPEPTFAGCTFQFNKASVDLNNIESAWFLTMHPPTFIFFDAMGNKYTPLGFQELLAASGLFTPEEAEGFVTTLMAYFDESELTKTMPPTTEQINRANQAAGGSCKFKFKFEGEVDISFVGKGIKGKIAFELEGTIEELIQDWDRVVAKLKELIDKLRQGLSNSINDQQHPSVSPTGQSSK